VLAVAEVEVSVAAVAAAAARKFVFTPAGVLSPVIQRLTCPAAAPGHAANRSADVGVLLLVLLMLLTLLL